MKAFALTIWGWLAANRADLISLAALASLAYGCHLAWEPLGWIVPGACVYLPPAVVEFRAAMLMLTPPVEDLE